MFFPLWCTGKGVPCIKSYVRNILDTQGRAILLPLPGLCLFEFFCREVWLPISVLAWGQSLWLVEESPSIQDGECHRREWLSCSRGPEEGEKIGWGLWSLTYLSRYFCLGQSYVFLWTWPGLWSKSSIFHSRDCAWWCVRGFIVPEPTPALRPCHIIFSSLPIYPGVKLILLVSLDMAPVQLNRRSFELVINRWQHINFFWFNREGLVFVHWHSYGV